MFGVVNHKCFFVVKNRLRLLKRNSVLPFVDGIFVFVLFKSDYVHNYIIIIL